MNRAGDVNAAAAAVADVVVDSGWRSTSLRERDCLAREEPRRREECRSKRALSLRVTFLLWGGGGAGEGMGGGRREVKHRKKERRNKYKKGETDREEEEKKGSYGG